MEPCPPIPTTPRGPRWLFPTLAMLLVSFAVGVGAALSLPPQVLAQESAPPASSSTPAAEAGELAAPVEPMAVATSPQTSEGLEAFLAELEEPVLQEDELEAAREVAEAHGLAWSRNPFALDFLEVGYQVDSRESKRVLFFEGHARPSERVDVAGQLDLESGLEDDLARFRLRAGVFSRVHGAVGLVARLEDFTGSANEHLRLGAYLDPWLGGGEPWARLELLPVSTDDGGAMARASFEVALRPRWTFAGFVESSWFGDEGDWLAAEPALRYRFARGLEAELEYRRDERQDELEGLALGLRAGL